MKVLKISLVQDLDYSSTGSAKPNASQLFDFWLTSTLSTSLFYVSVILVCSIFALVAKKRSSLKAKLKINILLFIVSLCLYILPTISISCLLASVYLVLLEIHLNPVVVSLAIAYIIILIEFFKFH